MHKIHANLTSRLQARIEEMRKTVEELEQLSAKQARNMNNEVLFPIWNFHLVILCI